jgi:hypothetical protein
MPISFPETPQDGGIRKKTYKPRKTKQMWCKRLLKTVTAIELLFCYGIAGVSSFFIK